MWPRWPLRAVSALMWNRILLDISSTLMLTLSISLANTCRRYKKVSSTLQQNCHYSKWTQPEFVKTTMFLYIHLFVHSFTQQVSCLPFIQHYTYYLHMRMIIKRWLQTGSSQFGGENEQIKKKKKVLHPHWHRHYYCKIYPLIYWCTRQHSRYCGSQQEAYSPLIQRTSVVTGVKEPGWW